MNCKKCGESVQPFDKFCPKCGANFDDGVSEGYRRGDQNQFKRVVARQQGDKQSDYQEHTESSVNSRPSYTEQPKSEPTYSQPPQQPYYGQQYAQPVSARNDQGVYGMLNRAFSSTEFLVACIFFSIGVIAQLFLLDGSLNFEGDNKYIIFFHIFPVLALVFMWIFYVSAYNGTMSRHATALKALSISVKVQWIMTWVLVGVLIVFGILSKAEVSSDADRETLERLADFAEFIAKIFAITLLSSPIFILFAIIDVIYIISLFGDDVSSSSSIFNSISASDTALIIIFVLAALIAVLNTACMGNMRKSIKSIALSAERGYQFFDKLGAASTALYFSGAVMLFGVIVSEFAVEAIFLAGGYGGAMIVMGLALSKLRREAKCF